MSPGRGKKDAAYDEGGRYYGYHGIYIYFDPRNEYVNMCGNTHVHYKNVHEPACVLYTHLHAFMKCCSTAPS